MRVVALISNAFLSFVKITAFIYNFSMSLLWSKRYYYFYYVFQVSVLILQNTKSIWADLLAIKNSVFRFFFHFSDSYFHILFVIPEQNITSSYEYIFPNKLHSETRLKEQTDMWTCEDISSMKERTVIYRCPADILLLFVFVVV